MKISVFGTGYVGLVTGVCFSELGNEVTCVDIDPAKVKSLKAGVSPIYEPGLEEMMTANIQAERLFFTTESTEAVRKADVIFIAVGTPSDVDGSADLRYVLQVAETIAKEMDGEKMIVTKSTVPVGTNQLVQRTIEKVLKERGVSHPFHLISNPEFLREGNAVEDCMKPARIIVGLTSESAEKMMRKLYEPFTDAGSPLIVMDLASAEMAKYAANAMLATRISLMNEFSRICDKFGADIEMVRKGIGSDPRIGALFINAGIGYGGSCFPKDVRALIHLGDVKHENLSILKAVEEANSIQRVNFISKLRHELGSFSGKKIALWGVAFKPGTDDIREAPSLDVIQAVLSDGGSVCAFDPVAAENAKALIADSHLTFEANQYAVLEGADALVIVTEWNSFREPDFAKIKERLKKPLIFDGRNIYSPKIMKEMGISYHSVGRPS